MLHFGKRIALKYQKNSVIPCLGINPKKIMRHSTRFQHCVSWMLCCRYKQPRYRGGFKQLSFSSCSHYMFITGPLEFCSTCPHSGTPTDEVSSTSAKSLVTEKRAGGSGKSQTRSKRLPPSWKSPSLRLTSHWLVQVAHKFLQEAEEDKAGAQKVSQKCLANSTKDHLACRAGHWSRACDPPKRPTAREGQLNHGAYSLKHLLSR